MKTSKQTIISTALLLVSIVNQILTAFGKSPLPFKNETVVSVVSLLFLGVSALIALKNGKGITKNSKLSKRLSDALKKGYVSDEKVEEFFSEIEDGEKAEEFFSEIENGEKAEDEPKDSGDEESKIPEHNEQEEEGK